VVTCIGYYSKHTLPFHFASGQGALPYIGHRGMYTLKGHGFLEISVRNRVSLVILVSTSERAPHSPAHFFSGSNQNQPPLPSPLLPLRTRLWVLRVQLSTFDLHNGSWSTMNDNLLENGVLFTQYLTLNFSISVTQRLIRMDAAF